MYIIVVGCSRVGISLAQSLETEGHNVVVIDRNQDASKKLGRSFNGTIVIGNGYVPEVLQEAGIERAHALVAATDNDNTNIVVGQVAKKVFGLERVLVRIYDLQRAETYQRLGLETVSATAILVNEIKGRLFRR